MMKKDDYRTEFEENRQEIDLNEESNGKIQSRTELHSKARKEKKRSGPKLINILLVLFTLIPVCILLYVVFTWDSPKLEPVNKGEDSEFQFEKSDKPGSKEKVVDEEQAKKETEEAEEQAKKEAEEERVQKEQEAKKAEEAQAQKAAEEEQAKIAQAQKEAEEQAKIEREAQAKKEQQEQAKKEAEKPAARSHTVAAGETLYRISVNYYKSGDGVSKIMAANGLSSNEISVGQTLVIP